MLLGLMWAAMWKFFVLFAACGFNFCFVRGCCSLGWWVRSLMTHLLMVIVGDWESLVEWLPYKGETMVRKFPLLLKQL